MQLRGVERLIADNSEVVRRRIYLPLVRLPVWQMRAIIANSIEMVKYEPQDKAVWDAAYDKYLSIVNKK